MEQLYLIEEYGTEKLISVNGAPKSKRKNYKIGRTFNSKKRVKTLQTANSNKLIIIGKYECIDCIILEKQIHDHYKGNRTIGEWFCFNDEELKECIPTINKYITEINERINNNTCNLCNFKTYENKIFMEHLKSEEHKNVIYTSSTHKCIICKYGTDNKSNYNKHLNSQNHKLTIKQKNVKTLLTNYQNIENQLLELKIKLTENT